MNPYRKASLYKTVQTAKSKTRSKSSLKKANKVMELLSDLIKNLKDYCSKNNFSLIGEYVKIHNTYYIPMARIIEENKLFPFKQSIVRIKSKSPPIIVESI